MINDAFFYYGSLEEKGWTRIIYISIIFRDKIFYYYFCKYYFFSELYLFIYLLINYFPLYRAY